MLAVINRYKVFFIILGLIIAAALVWLVLSAARDSSIPSKGVFVLRHMHEQMGWEGGSV